MDIMNWVQIIVAILGGIATAIPLVIKLVDVVKKSVKKNGITSAAETLGSTVAEINHNLFQLSKNIIKAYNDSISALMESQN